MTAAQPDDAGARVAEQSDYDDWVERLDSHARSKFEQMNRRITDLENGWRQAEAERDEYKALAEQREPISHAEFSRFVQEAKDQRDRAERAEVALAEHRAVVKAVLNTIGRSPEINFVMERPGQLEEQIFRRQALLSDVLKPLLATASAEYGAAVLEAGRAFVEHHKGGQPGEAGHPKTYMELDVWQAEWDRRLAALDRALAGRGEGR